MLYRLKLWTFFTVYKKNNKSVGYLKNFTSYNDMAISGTGIVFCKVLTKMPQALSQLVKTICKDFSGVDEKTVEKDAIEFYSELEKAGFVVSGNNEKEISEKDPPFSYSKKQEETSIVSGTKMEKESGWSLMVKELGGSPLLLETQIELTNRCNERCVHCYIPLDDRKNNCNIDIKPETFYNFLKQARDLGMLSIALTGGEAMLHKNFLDFLREIKKYGFSITIFSNLTLLTDEILKELQTPQIIAVRVSLYSMDATVHDSITDIKGSFEKTFSNIKKLVALGIPVQINTPIMKQNQHSFIDVMKWGEANNVRVTADYKLFASYDLTGQAQLKNRLTLQELEPIIKYLLPTDSRFIAEKNKLERKGHDFSTELCCGCCRYTFCMNAHGDIYPCTGWQSLVLGNINENSLDNIITNSEKAIYLRSLRRKQFEKCLSCEHIDICDFCLMRNALEDKDGNVLHLNKYYCDVAALHHRIIKDAIAESK